MMGELICACCNKPLPSDSFALGLRRPGAWIALSRAERRKGKDSDDYVSFTDKGKPRYFVRAVLELPIVGTDRHFEYGPWVELDEASFIDYGEHEDDVVAKHEWFGHVSIEPGYDIPDRLPVTVVQRVGIRPLLIARDEVVRKMQEEGVTTEYVHRLLAKHAGWS